MQCNQPLFCTGFQNNTQFLSYPTQPYYPDIIGEGDVMSYTLPDGSIQCYFVPSIRRIPHWTSSYYTPSNKEAWFVRSILNTFPTAGLNLLSNNYGDTFLRTNVNSPSCSFVQKFHNDGWTSTTDLHYFFPTLRHEWTKGCAAIQVEIPNAEKTIYHYGTVCNRPCYCHRVEITKVGSKCSQSEGTETPMCIDEVKSTHNCCNDSKPKGKKRSRNRNHTCACPRETADKVVATFADQGICCADTRGCSQTGPRRIMERTDIETEIWYPRRRKSKRNVARCSRTATASDSACCLGSAGSDADQLGQCK